MIYLNYKHERICFLRLNIVDYTNLNPELVWLDFEPDLAIGKVKEHYRAGIVGFKLSIHEVESAGPVDFSMFP